MDKWVIKNKKGEIEKLARELGVLPITAKLLCNRGISEKAEADKYLRPDYTSLYSPFEMLGTDVACGLIRKSIEAGEKLLVVGDYDVDGVTSTYTLESGLKALGADVSSRIPDRVKDGYGINESIIREAKDRGTSLIITCDNGIRAVDEVALAYELGMKVIVTDHHDIPETVPKAEVILNPKYAPCRYPYTELCGAVVALKLIEALNCKEGETHNFDIIKKYVEIAATATICDVVELKDENRCIVKLGLKKFHKGFDGSYPVNAGLQTLMQNAGLQGSEMDTYRIGFVIGPCINASGRLDTALKGLDLLGGGECANARATELLKLNENRKELTKEAVDKAERIIEDEGLTDKILVLLLEDCHESIAGIVAGRIREKYDRPTIVLTRGEYSLKGSARSIEACNITAELDKCSDLLLHYGGHAMAAGMSLLEDKLDEFRTRLNSNSSLTEEDFCKKVSIDYCMPASYASIRLCEEIEALAPFGTGNPDPLFADKNNELVSLRTIGKDGRYLKLRLRDETGSANDFVYFGDREKFEKDIADKYGAECLSDAYNGREAGIRLSVSYFPEKNLYNGRESVSLKLKNYLL